MAFGGITKDSLFTALRAYLADQPQNNTIIELSSLAEELKTRGVGTDLSPAALRTRVTNYLSHLFSDYGAVEVPYSGNRKRRTTCDRCLLRRSKMIDVTDDKLIRKNTTRKLPAKLRCNR